MCRVKLAQPCVPHGGVLVGKAVVMLVVPPSMVTLILAAAESIQKVTLPVEQYKGCKVQPPLVTVTLPFQVVSPLVAL